MTDRGQRGNLRTIVSWCLFDWANSPHPTIIVTFVFAAYFSQAVVGDEILGSFLWSQAITAAGLLVALLGPIVGAIADQGGRFRVWNGSLTAVCLVATAALWLVTPEESSIPLAMVAVAIATLCFELVTVFYNSSLGTVAPPDRVGRISGWGWGSGYIAAILCLVLCLLVFVQADTPPFGLDTDAAEHVRVTALVVVAWWILFGWPYYLWVPDPPGEAKRVGEAVRSGLVSLYTTLRNLRQHRNTAMFLLARMLYADGLATLFQFGGLYAAGTFGMSFAEIIQFGIAMNVTAGLGAFAFAWFDDRLGSRAVIVISLAGLLGFGLATLLAQTALWFWIFGLGLCVFIGPIQASSRTLMTRIAPADMRTEMFGLYAFSGKATSFLGPMLFGWATLLFESQRAGMATILVFWLAGLLLILLVRVPAPQRPGTE